MLPDRISNPGPLTYESGALSIALRGPALEFIVGKGNGDISRTFGFFSVRSIFISRMNTKSSVCIFTSGEANFGVHE